MKKLLIIILMLWAADLSAQTTGYFRYDTIRLQKGGGNSELIIENSTRDTIGGVLTNVGGGLTRFITPTSGGGGSGGNQKLDLTLRNGNTTRQTYIVDDTLAAAGSGLTFHLYKPRNYGIAYTTGTQSSFLDGYGYYPGVNADGRPNVVGLLYGYNGGFNTATIAGEPTWGVRAENWFQLGGIGHTELHGVSPEFKSIDGVTRRLGTYYVNNLNGFTTYTQQINSYSMFNGATDSVIASFTPNAINFGSFGNGYLAITNSRAATNFWSTTLGNSGPTIDWGGTVPAATYLTFAKPVQFNTSATYGTTVPAAAISNINQANKAGFRSVYVPSTGSGYGATITGSSSGFMYSTLGQNSGTGGTGVVIEANAGGKAELHISDQTAGTRWYNYMTTGTNQKTLKWGYGSGSTDSVVKMRGDNGNVYFKYSASVGLQDPTARLHLAAGTATASTAPLKFITGTALTTPEDGAVEYHGSHLYFTIGSTRYQLDQQSGGGGNPNSNVGSAYRLAIPNTNNIKTLAAGLAIAIDSATSNEIKISVDTAALPKDTLILADGIQRRGDTLGLPCKRYKAVLTQNGTSDPIVDYLLENSLGGTVVWTRDSPGNYTATLSGAFTANKTTTIQGVLLTDVDDDVNYITGVRGDDDTYIIKVGNPTDGEIDDIIRTYTIEIEVYYP